MVNRMKEKLEKYKGLYIAILLITLIIMEIQFSINSPDSDSIFVFLWGFVFFFTGIACVLKHFPGSGNSDTHYGASSIDLDYKLFCDSCEVFRKPLSQSLAVMASHVIVPCLDTVPFCISHKGISFLRNHFNYSGIVMSDDIIMKALEPYCKNYVDLACQAISAGCDLILYSASDFTNLIQGIADRARQDSRLSERIDEAVHTILITKLKIGLLADENATVKNSEFVKSHFIDAYNQGLSVYEIFKE